MEASVRVVSDDGAVIRSAKRGDVRRIVELLVDDELGATRERLADPIPESYETAFDEIDRDPSQELVVLEVDGMVMGTLHLTIIPYLTYEGRPRGMIEAVRIDRQQRGSGFGERLVRWAIDRARHRGCHMVQMTSDKRRPDALRFYQRLGFVPSHEGMKLRLG
jgi:GNAT superfamily N-acetyltransferase